MRPTRFLIALIWLLGASSASAEPLAAPGDLRLRHDLQLLNDRGVIEIPMTAWPVALGDIYNALLTADGVGLDAPTQDALRRVKDFVARELRIGAVNLEAGLSASSEPRVIRTFEATPREEGEVNASLSWLGNRFAVNLAATYVSNPFDGDEIRPDGSYVGLAFGNWMLTAGWQERWFGPGRDGSLILSNNVRPMPGIALQRNLSTPFATKWLRWIGPWTLTTFMNELDDDRIVSDALLWGIRFSFKPISGLEIGLSRTAQWCGDNRPCDFSTFGDVLLGKDNSGVNVGPDEEPGNQLAGIDMRWALPNRVPAALYMQWIGEDSRQGGPEIGSWLRQFGVELRGSVGGISHRTHFEWADTECREGGFGFADEKPNCAYNHPIYSTGYRYKLRSIGHSTDGDSESYSLGSTLVQSAGHTWNATLRYMEINRAGAPNIRHSLTPTTQDLIDVQLSHKRDTSIGRLYIGISYAELDDAASGRSDSDFAAFLQWSSR